MRLMTILLVFFSSFASSETIRLATTTSVENSGLLTYLLPKFKQSHHQYDIDIAVVGSGKALRMGRTGKADLVWVHSPKAEQKFINDGYGKMAYQVMRNEFVIAGPLSDPSGIAASKDVFQALAIIAEKNGLFVSRADDSGTNKKELSLWRQANIDTYLKEWYVESGSGMAAALRLAEQERAYVLIDRATFVVRKSDAFKVLVEDSENLSTSYSLIAVEPGKVDGVNYQGAKALINWLVSKEGQAAIGSFAHNGMPLYQPAAL